jgi:hypothetical protein
MSMSQEEIEALMSGAESTEEDETEEVSVDEQENDVAQDAQDESQEIDPSENATDEVQEIEQSENIADEVVEDNEDDTNIDDMLAGIDGIVDDGSDIQEDIDNNLEQQKTYENGSMEDLIESNQYPMPVRNENKVVNQLNEVADDSEEKASQIFDVLSFILDENNDIQNYNKSMGEFIDTQVVLLDALSKKFPNIDVFSQNLETAKTLVEDSKSLSSKIDGENNKVFEAMELMQYHDINRQKIERVMAVIKKLNCYLNGIFEDDNGKPEVQIAKHISGDSNDIVGADDIDSLIAEFSEEG